MAMRTIARISSIFSLNHDPPRIPGAAHSWHTVQVGRIVMKPAFAAIIAAALATTLAAGCASRPKVEAQLYHANGEICPEGSKAPSDVLLNRTASLDDCRTEAGWRIARQVDADNRRYAERKNQFRQATMLNYAPEPSNN